MFRSSTTPSPTEEDQVPQANSRRARQRARRRGHQGPANDPSPSSTAVYQPGLAVVPYSDYFQEILCFTNGDDPAALVMIREKIRVICTQQHTKAYMVEVTMPCSDIPQGDWSFAFAPSIFDSGSWALVFADPRDPEALWFIWPETKNSEAQMIQLLAGLRTRGEIRSEEGMGIGSERYIQFHAMMQQAFWRYLNASILGGEVRPGRFA